MLKFENLTGKIFDRLFIPVRESYKVIGKTAKKTIKRNQPIEFSDLDG